ncbi:MAG: hypothetical protein KJ958_13250 [Gammaproteobacteria bacterium]|nr:hypothetical protein [Gammaproteobacteria bacterium]MBU1980125.1 hypothetical protein [Gammaproteobacteria bacterium]
MFGLFRSKPLLDEDSTEWLFSAYAWALRNLGSEVFRENAILVTPSDRHFPDQSSGTAEEKVSTAFVRVRAYAGMQDWPCELTALSSDMNPGRPLAISSAPPKEPQGAVSIKEVRPSIPIAFDPGMIRKPIVLVAAFAQQLGYHLGRAVEEESPGGEELRGPTSDLLAVFMGFGLFMANSALTVSRGGCSGCCTSAQKLGYLTEDEFVYALAIFCVLKNIPNAEVEPHLKKTLRPFFRKAVKEINKTGGEDILRLKTLGTATH